MRAPTLAAAAMLLAAVACAPASERGADSVAAADGLAPPRDIIPADGTADSVPVPAVDTVPASAPRAATDSVTRAPRPTTGPTVAAGMTTPGVGAAQGGVTARGVVRLAGSAPTQRLVLRRDDGGTLPLDGDVLTALRRAGGTEVEVRGKMRGESFDVSSFTVVAADGAPAFDGVLERSGEALVLRTATGPVTLGNPPRALLDQVGARVWITGDPTIGPNAFGILSPK